MPTYDYQCDNNGRVVEVKHSMNHQLKTWGELCELAGISQDNTLAETPVKKLANGGQIVNRSSMGSGNAPACETGTCCGPTNCQYSG